MSHIKGLKAEIAKEMSEKFGYKNPMEVPKIEKISLNIGLKSSDDSKFLTYVLGQLTLIAGQKAIATFARKSIAGFKLREGVPLGAKVTLRGDKAFEFLDRLVYIALPRVRDFRGLAKNGASENGNYNFGIKEHAIFPEIDYNKIERSLGLNVTIVTSATSKEETIYLLRRIGLPIK